MGTVSWGLIIGISVGVLIGLLLATAIVFFLRFQNRHSQIVSSSSRRNSTVSIRTNGVDSCAVLSDSTSGQESPQSSEAKSISFWMEGSKKKNMMTMSGIPKYLYKDLQKATTNFTTIIGEGAFGSVYRAQMSTGGTVAVKVLAANSKQGEMEFQSEVLLLGRLHHRNLVNLMGYCTEKGQHMLIYAYMPNGSLASHLYGEKHEPLCWDLRLHIALDVGRGLEYLHDGAIPPVIHRDIKSSNILLDKSMRARVSDFGLSREEMINPHESNVRGTFGYLDPEYISSRTFTKKSDVYSFGVMLFELITGRNPLQGLMDYVELAAMNSDSKGGWEEIVDSRLDSNYNLQELNEMAALAHKCIHRSPRRRPSMRDIVQSLLHIPNGRQSRRRYDPRPIFVDEEIAETEKKDSQITISDPHGEELTCNSSDLPAV